MKRHALLFSALFAVNLAYSQVGIGTNTPNPDALLELNASGVKGGLLLPRVALTSTIAAAPLAEHVEGMTLYNTVNTPGTNGVSPGYYYNNGTKWVKLEATTPSVISTSWSIQGNANTHADHHFIGTTDKQPLIFKADKGKVGFLTYEEDGNLFFGASAGRDARGSNNIGIGQLSLAGTYMTGSWNTANGVGALSSNRSGDYNTAFGGRALIANSTGNHNTANGFKSLHSNKEGSNNTANGYQAMYTNTNGNNNTATGASALYANTIGNNNTATGANALHDNITGANNTAMGFEALKSNTDASNNTAIGYQSLYANTTGERNTAVGVLALKSNTTGSGNTAIGEFADVSANNLSNATAIGNGAIVNASNKVRIGNTDVTSIEGQVPFTTPSDARFKSNVQQNVPGLAFITQLNPVTYYFDNQKMGKQLNESAAKNKPHPTATKQIKTGFLAQEVEKAAHAIHYDFDGVIAPENEEGYYTLSYSQFVVPLVQTVKEQQQIIHAQNLKTETLESTIQKQQALIESMQSKMEELEAKMNF